MSTKTYKKVSVVKLSSHFTEATKVVTVPLIPPNDDQILIKNLYAGVNASDVVVSAGLHSDKTIPPFDIGYEAMGVIDSVGKNVKDFKVGQTVMTTTEPKCYAEYVYLKSEEIIPIPDIKPEYIALMIAGLTASIGLDQSGRIKSGDKVLITAAAGGTGHICVQWAKQRGCHVIGTTSSKDKEKLLKELGCDRVINYKEESIDEVLTKEYPKGIDVVWETVGGETFDTLFKHLSTRGRLAIVGSISSYLNEGKPVTKVEISDLSSKLLVGAKSLNGFYLPVFLELQKEYLTKLIGLFDKKELKVVLDFGKTSTNGLFEGIDSVVRAVEYLENGHNIGKVVIKIQDK